MRQSLVDSASRLLDLSLSSLGALIVEHAAPDGRRCGLSVEPGEAASTTNTAGDSVTGGFKKEGPFL